MKSKVAAAADFVASTPKAVGIIGSPDEMRAIIDGRSGTRIVIADAASPANPGPAIPTLEPTGGSAVLLAVNGTLMRGLRLNPNMLSAGATFVREAITEPVYRLWTINDNHPAMIRVTDGSGVAVELEVWSVPATGLAAILLKEPTGLTSGKVKLSDGSTVLGVLGESALVEGQSEITALRGWRRYMNWRRYINLKKAV
jgi:hypothetical protein